MSDNALVHQDTFNLLCGDLIARGMSRTVFACRLLPDCVVKVEETAGHFQNVIEWQIWQSVKGTDFAKWFAPCRWISPNGAVLVMERTRPAGLSDFPARVPMFLADLKRTNFGMAPSSEGKDQFVCHDYGTSLMLEHGMTKRLKKAEWWDEL